MKAFVLDGNDRCLDFLNTEMFEGDQRIELLEDFTDLVDWLKVSGLVNAGTGGYLFTRPGSCWNEPDAFFDSHVEAGHPRRLIST